jgi:hypothetical protein
MENTVQGQLFKVTESIFAYLPNLLTGTILILMGWLAGWIIKRVIVQFLILSRIDRFLRKSPLGADFSKADVRYSVSKFIGNIGFAVVLFIFIDSALVAWKLDMLSNIIGKGILFLPKLILAFVIFGVGWFLSLWAQVSVYKALRKERISRASLIARFVKSILLLFFCAIAFVELDIAKEIVIICFTTIIVTLCAIAVAVTVIGGKDFLMKIEESLKD